MFRRWQAGRTRFRHGTGKAALSVLHGHWSSRCGDERISVVRTGRGLRSLTRAGAGQYWCSWIDRR
jgi:hypothetical protein